MVSVPGMSVTFYIQKFLEKEKNNDFKYIQSEGETLSRFNFLDLNFDKNEKALKIAENYFKNAKLSQKFVLVINTPFILDNTEFQQSIIGSHLYNSYYFKVLDLNLIKIFADLTNIKLTDDEIQRMHILSGGLTRIIKFFLNHKEMVGLSASKILENSDFKRVFLPTAEVIEKCEDEILEKLGIKVDGQFVGGVLKIYFISRQQVVKIGIKINSDLTFYENERLNKVRLLEMEKDILEEAIKNKGPVSKEKIADFKWGEGSYDKYSDQAISKTMQRLNLKLRSYQFEPILTFGYKLINKK